MLFSFILFFQGYAGIGEKAKETWPVSSEFHRQDHWLSGSGNKGATEDCCYTLGSYYYTEELLST